MKESKLIAVLMVILIALGWVATLTADDSEAVLKQKEHLELAEDYMKRGLYQKAIMEYEEALAVEESQELRDAQLKAYDCRYEEDRDIYEEYVGALKEAADAYIDEEKYVVRVAELYMDQEEYPAAYRLLNRSIEEGATSQAIYNLQHEARYAYDIHSVGYDYVRKFHNGYCEAGTEEGWTYISAAGEESGYYEMVGTIGDDDISFIYKDRAMLMDGSGLIHGLIAGKPARAGVYSEGLIPVKVGLFFGYYDLLGDYRMGKYELAYGFTGGEAAVKRCDGWALIDTEGKDVSSERYTNIIINANGTHRVDGIMLARQNNKYAFIDSTGKRFGAYDRVDMITGHGPTAVCVDGKWGFANTDGTMVIAPTYRRARSFSYGLAAVYNGKAWGFIDSTGKLAIDYTFEDARHFTEEGTCFVKNDGEWDLISLYNWEAAE